MEHGNLFSEFEGTPGDVRDARRRLRGSMSTLLGDVLHTPVVAKSGLRRDWKRTSERLSAAALIRRYPAGAIALAVVGGVVVGRKLLERNSENDAAHGYAQARPIHSMKEGAFDHIRRLLRNNVVTDDAVFRARKLALSLAGQLAAAALSRIIAEHVPRQETPE